jgi:hypothetical protein
MDIVDKIVTQQKDDRDIPLEDVVIEKAFTFTK